MDPDGQVVAVPQPKWDSASRLSGSSGEKEKGRKGVREQTRLGRLQAFSSIHLSKVPSSIPLPIIPLPFEKWQGNDRQGNEADGFTVRRPDAIGCSRILTVACEQL